MKKERLIQNERHKLQNKDEKEDGSALRAATDILSIWHRLHVSWEAWNTDTSKIDVANHVPGSRLGSLGEGCCMICGEAGLSPLGKSTEESSFFSPSHSCCPVWETE